MTDRLDHILIVEDEPLIAEDIQMSLEDAGYGVVKVIHRGEEAIAFLEDHAPTLVLLDIQLSGEKTGLDVGQYIRDHHDIPFIFLTSFTDAATLQKVHALKADGYIVKPFHEKELAANVGLAIERHKNNSKHLGMWEERNDAQLFVKQDGKLYRFTPEEVLYAQAFDNYAYLFISKSRYLLPITLKKLEDRLGQRDFFRIHRSHLVRLDRIQEVGDDYVKMEGGLRLPLSRSGKAELIKRIELI